MVQFASHINRAEDNLSFSENSLSKYSRTFAFTIPKLPKDLRRDMAVGYSVCRAIDAIEDST